MAELWGLREGPCIAKKKCMRNLEIKIDSEILANALNKGVVANHPLEVLLRECKKIMSEVNALGAKQVYREANRCTDMPVKLGQEVALGVREVVSPPAELEVLISE
ncbi:Ribonuclease H domain [Dillenia turbinata]|uniref:Ribonuclease H domain n=1 Tax=Dillenia turbinata TaxID=194707 RepID=A0AAN8ZDW0_9MAGN